MMSLCHFRMKGNDEAALRGGGSDMDRFFALCAGHPSVYLQTKKHLPEDKCFKN